ncbi:MAG: hypothetical protein IPO40_19135 [Fibrobacteres bacterium]|nr:hypothetical protein [Fibrobacterota bacterium]
MLGYAETHFKFKLPWSPLSRALPEMIVDAPSLALPDQPIPLTLAVHDAHRFGVRLDEVRIVARSKGQIHEVTWTPTLTLDQPFHWIRLPCPGPLLEGAQWVDAAFRITDRKGKCWTFLNHNLPGLSVRSLRVLRLATVFPAPAGWVSGDLHCHTHWSEDPVEWGGDPTMMREAARCMGMGFYAATDHSYDFAWEHPDYLRPADPHERFQAFRSSLPPDQAGEPVVLPAEEISCGNSRGENIHLLAIDHPDYIPGQGDGGRRGLDNRPDLSIPQVLEHLTKSGAPAFAAHPRPGIGWLQRKIFRRGQWDDVDLHAGIHGLQICNGSWGRDFMEGRGLWVQDLVAGNRRLPIAGNDAHGDLNRATQVAFPLVSLRQTDHHRFGNMRTWILPEGAPNRQSLRTALTGAPCVISDGPWLELRVPEAAHPAERSEGLGSVQARSLPEFGNIQRVLVFRHEPGQERETLVLDVSPAALESHHAFEVPADTRYVRAEILTESGNRALTRAVEPSA